MTKKTESPTLELDDSKIESPTTLEPDDSKLESPTIEPDDLKGYSSQL